MKTGAYGHWNITRPKGENYEQRRRNLPKIQNQVLMRYGCLALYIQMTLELNIAYCKSTNELHVYRSGSLGGNKNPIKSRIRT